MKRTGRFLDHAAFGGIGLAMRDSNRIIDALGTQAGRPLGMQLRTHDGRFVDSTGGFLVGELERLDLTLHAPLAAVTWGRDIDLRSDVTIADEVSSFTLTNFASNGGLGVGNGIGTGKAWIGKTTDQISGVAVDMAKIPHQLRLYGLELKYSIPELESSARLGRPIDVQKFEALQLKYQMDVDEQVYIGDTTMGDTGLCNNSLVTNVQNFPDGAASGTNTTWAVKTPDEILADVNLMLTSCWTASGFSVMPNKIGIPPVQFGYISTQKVSSAGNISILKYLLENNILTTSGQGRLEIVPMKWLVGAGVGGTIGTTGTVDRAIAYNQSMQYVRFPMTSLQRTPIQYESIYHKTTYYCRLGSVEVVFPKTICYFDGL